jgi:hypothetical protein
MNQSPKSTWPWRLLRWGLIGFAGLATLAAILITEENWRGKHDWEAYRRAAEARGDRLDLAYVTPPAVPDDENFFAAPIVAQTLKSLTVSNGINPLKFDLYRGDSAKWPVNGDWQRGTLTDLKAWQRYFQTLSESPAGQTNGFPLAPQPQTPAADVLLALSPFDPALEELRQASLRPQARFPLNYDQGFGVVGDFVPWLTREKRVAQFLELRTLAELEAGHTQQALDDIKLSLRLIDTTRNQPFLISHLVRIAMTVIALQPVYEGLAQHRWNDAQLADLETTLAAPNFLADFELAMRGERTCGISWFETQRLTREMKSTAFDNQTVTNSLRWMPSAYFYQNELALARMYEQFVLPLADPTNRIVSVTASRAGEQGLQQLTNHYSLYNIQARMIFPNVGRSIMRFAYAQTGVELARVACALERYRLAHNEYPATLEPLDPQYIKELPHDVINGQPLHYHRTETGSFVLYSVGWNETDDGGTIGLNKEHGLDLEKGDWVWRY